MDTFYFEMLEGVSVCGMSDGWLQSILMVDESKCIERCEEFFMSMGILRVIRYVGRGVLLRIWSR